MTDFHAFERGGENLLYFPRSARLYHLSPQAARMLPAYELCLRDRCADDIPVPLQLSGDTEQSKLRLDLHELLRSELALPAPVSSPLSEPEGGNRFHTFSLYLAQTCNMSCSYCWNRGGSFGKAPDIMGPREAEDASSLILSLAGASKATEFFVNFYGGEPLLNFPVLKQVTQNLLAGETRLGKKFYFTADTNGFLLEGETAQFLAAHFAQIGVSLDGREEIHDKQRPGKFGGSTWRKVINNIKAFPKPEILGLRATLTVQSDSYLDTFRQLSGAGVRRIHLEYCHEACGHDHDADDDLSVPLQRQVSELYQFVADYVESIGSYRDTRDIPRLSNLMDNIIRVKRGIRSRVPCGAGINTLAFDCHGRVFPCIAFVSRPDFSMRLPCGNGLSLHQALATFDVDREPPCNACWLRYDCAGGCYATKFDLAGRQRNPPVQYCSNMKAKFELYLYALALMLRKCPWHLEQQES